MDLGDMYHSMSEIDQAKVHFNEALQIYERYPQVYAEDIKRMKTLLPD